GQESMQWKPDYTLQLSDYQSPQTEINPEFTSFSIYSGSKIDFSFTMNSVSYMFTKNFNDKVRAVFHKNLAVLIAPDSLTAQQLLRFGQYDFDLVELYSRKIREKIYHEKGAFTNSNFFEPIFDALQEEMNTVSAHVFKATEFGKDSLLLEKEHEKVLRRLRELDDFCANCKPRKSKC
ncbi:MAG: hypothetical protein WA810_06645, partial [Maribacter sp.]